MTTLVTGATGFVGRALIPALIDAGHDVRAATRRPASYRGPGTPVAFDADDPSTAAPALAGCDVAYYLVHGMAERGDLAEREVRSATAFARAAAAQGARVIYLGGLGRGAAGINRSAHLRSRHLVGDALRASADTVELAAAVIIGNGSVAYDTLRDLVARVPVIVAPDWVRTRSQPIALADAVRYLVAAPSIPAGVYGIGGADVLSYEDMVRRYARVVGRRPVIVKVPVLAPGLTAHSITKGTELMLQIPGLSSPRLNPVSDHPLPTSLRLAEGISVEMVVTDDRIRSLVPLDPVGYEDAVRATLATASRRAS